MVRRFLIGLVVLGVIGYAGWKVLSQAEYRIYALDAATGKVVWSANLPTSKRSTSIPFAADGRVYVGLVTNAEDYHEAVSLSAFDAQSGTPLWEFSPDLTQFPSQDTITWFTQRPYALGDLVFMTLRSTEENTGPTLLAIDAQNGTLRWTLDHTFEAEQGAIPEVAMAGGKLIVLQWENVDKVVTYFARVIDPQTGKVLQDLITWKPDEWGNFDSFDNPYLVGTEDGVFILTDKAIYAFDAATGTRKFSIEVSDARYAVSADGLFVRQSDSISAYDVQTGEQRWTYKAKSFVLSRNYFNWITADHGTVEVICNCVEDSARYGTALYVFDAQTGALRYSQVTSDAYYETYFQRALAAEDVVLIPAGRFGGNAEYSGIVALDANDGSVRWQFVTAPTRLKAPATDGKHVFVTAFDSRLRAWLTPMNTEWRFTVGREAQ